MKRKNNLYQNTYKMENILDAYNEVCRNTKNSTKLLPQWSKVRVCNVNK